MRCSVGKRTELPFLRKGEWSCYLEIAARADPCGQEADPLQMDAAQCFEMSRSAEARGRAGRAETPHLFARADFLPSKGNDRRRTCGAHTTAGLDMAKFFGPSALR